MKRLKPQSILIILLSLFPPQSTSLSIPTTPHLLWRAPPPINRATLAAGDFVCRTTGECSPCPLSELNSPSCQLYGNRRPLSCVASPSLLSSSNTQLQQEQAKHAALLRTGTASLAPARKPVAGEAIKPKEGVREGTDPDPMGIDDDAFRDSVLKSGKDVGGGVEKSWEDQGREQEESEEESEEDEGGRRARAKRRKERRRMGDTALREMYTWEACERVVKKERADFVEFVLCNLFFALTSLSILIIRHRNLALRQYGKLAARINFSHTGQSGTGIMRTGGLGVGSVSL